MHFGYITNGFRDHRLGEVFPLLRDLGYTSVGITLDVGHLDPFATSAWEVRAVRAALCGLHPVVETGARYVLDPRRKHSPTLLCADPKGRGARLDYLRRSVDVACDLGAQVISFWSGAADPLLAREDVWGHLVEGIGALADYAQPRGIVLGFEPEPGMFVESLDDYRELRRRFDDDRLKLTLDIGHLECTETPPHDRWIRELADVLVNVHVDDIKDRVHDHLPLGEGDIDFPPLFAALRDIGYEGACNIELARHSHAAPEMAQRMIEALRGYAVIA